MLRLLRQKDGISLAMAKGVYKGIQRCLLYKIGYGKRYNNGGVTVVEWRDRNYRLLKYFAFL